MDISSARMLCRRTSRVGLAAILAIASSSAIASAGPKRFLAYYTSWSKERSPAYSAAQIPYTKLTHIAHALLYLDTKADERFAFRRISSSRSSSLEHTRRV